MEKPATIGSIMAMTIAAIRSSARAVKWPPGPNGILVAKDVQTTAVQAQV